MPRQSHRMESTAGVPRTARWTGDASANSSPFSSTSSTVDASSWGAPIPPPLGSENRWNALTSRG